MTSQLLARAQVRVPATTANLGAGFDCVGMALDRWLRVSVELRTGNRDEEGLVTIHRTGTLRELDRDEAGISDVRRDLIYVGFERTVRQFRGERGFRGSVHFEGNSDIPIGRGLGSSAAALLAGAALANSALNLGLGIDQLARICAELEGHGDNVGAAAYGGVILVAPREAGGRYFTPIPVHHSLGFAFAVPAFETRTELARAALPDSVPFSTAADAAGRAACLVVGLQTGHAGALAVGLDDVLHVPHRKRLVPHFERVALAARNAGAFGATLSGSGSSIVAIAPRALASGVAERMADAWRLAGVDARGFATGAGRAGLTVLPSTSRTSDLPTPESALPVRLPRSIACP